MFWSVFTQCDNLIVDISKEGYSKTSRFVNLKNPLNLKLLHLKDPLVLKEGLRYLGRLQTNDWGDPAASVKSAK
jgi:hypothetical protein